MNNCVKRVSILINRDNFSPWWWDHRRQLVNVGLILRLEPDAEADIDLDSDGYSNDDARASLDLVSHFDHTVYNSMRISGWTSNDTALATFKAIKRAVFPNPAKLYLELQTISTRQFRSIRAFLNRFELLLEATKHTFRRDEATKVIHLLGCVRHSHRKFFNFWFQKVSKNINDVAFCEIVRPLREAWYDEKESGTE